MWNKLRTEYKFAIIFASICFAFLIIFMIKNNTIENAIIEQKKKNLRDCITYDNDNYLDYTCTVKDENGVTVRGIAYEDLDNKFKEIGVNISETDRKYIIKTYRMKNSKLINADKLKSDLNKTNIKYLDTERVI